jgi:hypothetical protein
VRRPPSVGGTEAGRWTLALLARAVDWLCGRSPAAIHQLLDRFRIYYRRGRRYVHSPDPLYDAKLAWIAAARDMAATSPRQFVFLYQDELTYYRRPTVARDYAPAGADAPRADQGWGPDTKRRVIGSLDAQTGRLFAWQRAHSDVDVLIRYYRELEAAYPAATTIFLAQDNWPVHAHPRIEAAISATKITVLWLPTYAPWTNPIEKVWRKLYQEVLHLHRWQGRWGTLVEAVGEWLGRYAQGSLDLLRYVGLHPD